MWGVLCRIIAMPWVSICFTLLAGRLRKLWNVCRLWFETVFTVEALVIGCIYFRKKASNSKKSQTLFGTRFKDVKRKQGLATTTA
jgi:hypothetical protein